MAQYGVQPGSPLILVVHGRKFRRHAVVAMDVHVVEIPRFIQLIPAQVGVDSRLGDLLGRDVDHELLLLLVPENVDQSLKFRRIIHIAAEK